MAFRRSSAKAYRVLVLAAGIAVLWVATGVTLNLTLGVRAPALALALWPYGALANIGAVTDVLKAGKPNDQENARGRAAMRAAMLREPANSTAVANYAALTDFAGDGVGAERLFRLSETLSRRNMLAQVWLIESAVQRGKVGEAITHYNRALTVSRDLRSQLLPILASASSDPEIRTSLLPVLAQRPPWWRDYLTELAKSSESAIALYEAGRAVRLDGRNATDAALGEALLRRMVSLKGYRAAIVLAEALAGRRSSARGLVGGNFDTNGGVLPFGWWLSDSAGVRAYRDTVPTGSGLRIEASEGVLGGAAQQLVGLAPGNYTLSGVVGDLAAGADAGLRIAIVCADGESIGDFRLPSAGSSGRGFTFGFVVPATGCQAQWVNIAATTDAEMRTWIDSLRVAKSG